MKGRLFVFAVSLAISLAASTADAGWSEFWHRVSLDWHRMNCWPEPFQHADQQAAVMPLIAMTNSGWRAQNTLSHHFFDSESQELTQAGELKIHWIATQVPMHRRAVFILRANDPNATSARVTAVKQFLAKILPDSPHPDVLLTDIIPPGGSGEYFDAVDRQLKSSVPAPRLPEMENTMGSDN